MADITWPTDEGVDFDPEGFDEAIEFNVELTVARSGRVVTQSLPGARFRCVMQFKATSVSRLVPRRRLYALLARLRGGADRLLLWNLLTPTPLGNMRGTPTLAATVAAGDSAASLAGCLAGNNLLRSLDQMVTFLATGWSLFNATVTANSVTDPLGTTTGWTLTRTATGNHYAYQTATVASTINRTVTSIVWLKAGTLTGDVVLRLRDGAGTEFASATVTPTGSWVAYYVSGTFSGASVANVQLYIDPANDTGSAGDTLFAWFSDVRVASGFDTLCTAWNSYVAPPAGQSGTGDEVRRTNTGNAYTAWTYSTTSHANQTYTFSVWLRAGTFSGVVSLFLRDGSGTQIASATPTITSTWTRYSITGTFGASPAANIVAFVDQAEGGSVGETFERYGAMLELWSTPTDYYPLATLLAGDFIGFGGQRVMLTADATATESGDVTVAFQPAHRAGAASSGAVTLTRPTTRYVVTSPVVQMPAQGSKLPGFAVELVEE